MNTIRFEGLTDEDLDYNDPSDNEILEEDDIPTYPIDQIKFNFKYGDRYILAGPPTSGKSTIIRHLLAAYWKTGRIVSTYWYGAHADYEIYLPPGRTCKTINKQQIVKLRKVMLKYFKPKGLFSIIVLDDVMGEKLRNGKEGLYFSELFTQSRHENIIIICALHDMMRVDPSVRDSITRYIITKSNVKLVDKLFGQSTSFANKRKFREAILGITKGEPLMMDNSENNDGCELHRLIVSELDSL